MFQPKSHSSWREGLHIMRRPHASALLRRRSRHRQQHGCLSRPQTASFCTTVTIYQQHCQRSAVSLCMHLHVQNTFACTTCMHSQQQLHVYGLHDDHIFHSTCKRLQAGSLLACMSMLLHHWVLYVLSFLKMLLLYLYQQSQHYSRPPSLSRTGY